MIEEIINTYTAQNFPGKLDTLEDLLNDSQQLVSLQEFLPQESD